MVIEVEEAIKTKFEIANYAKGRIVLERTTHVTQRGVSLENGNSAKAGNTKETVHQIYESAR